MDEIVKPPLPSQDPINPDSVYDFGTGVVDLGKRRQAQEADELVADLMARARSGSVDGATMIEFGSKFARLSAADLPGAKPDIVSPSAVVAVAECIARLAELLPKANNAVAITLAQGLRGLVLLRQQLEDPGAAAHSHPGMY